MFSAIFSCISKNTTYCRSWCYKCKRNPWVGSFIRKLTVGETNEALRPFFFAVHPDLFGKYPKERTVNENSLKKLNEYVTALQNTGNGTPTEVTFYIRPENVDEKSSKAEFKKVKIPLQSKNIRTTVRVILDSCNISADYVNRIPEKSDFASSFRPIKWDPLYYAATGKQNPDEPENIVKTEMPLWDWFKENLQSARRLTDNKRVVQDEIDEVRDRLIEEIGLEDIQWKSVWGYQQYRSSIKAFDNMFRMNPAKISSVLQGKTLIFSNATGISAYGDVVISSADVPTHWMRLFMSIQAYDTVLERLPSLEEKLSVLLNGMKVVHRKRKEITMAVQYELLLNKLINSLRRCQNYSDAKLFKEDLSHLEVVAESESGPFTMSSTGQFLVPVSVPGHQVIEFISTHKADAAKLLQETNVNLQTEKRMIGHCKDMLNLKSLTKDETVMPTQMVQCCDRLMNYYSLPETNSVRLRISHYYSIMQDGEVCIPWNFKN